MAASSRSQLGPPGPTNPLPRRRWAIGSGWRKTPLPTPPSRRAVRKSFDIPADATVKQAALALTADDRCTLWLNGEQLATNYDWRTLKRLDNIESKLKPGRNVLAIRAENVKADVPKNPAGLICGLSITLKQGDPIEIKSDTTWRANREEPANWQQPAFDDAAWSQAKLAARYGGGPWGKIAAAGPTDTPSPTRSASPTRFASSTSPTPAPSP